MKKVILTILFLLTLTSFIHLNAQWARTYDGNEHDEATCIQQTTDGGYIVAGWTNSFGVANGAFWVIKVSSDGLIEWQRAYGGDFSEMANSIQQTTDGGYIVAGYSDSFGGRDVWIIKLSSVGDIEWQRAYGEDSIDVAYSIQQADDGGYIVAGYTDDRTPFGAGSKDIWIIKLTSVGDIEWQRSYGYGGSEYDEDDCAYSIQQTSDGGYIVAGFNEESSHRCLWVLKLSATGDIEWEYTYGMGWGGVIEATSIQQTTDGGYVVAGFSELLGSRDFWILKLSATGNSEWQRIYGGSSDDSPFSIQQTSDSGYIVAGETLSFGGGAHDFWVLKLTSIGDVEWQHAYGGSSDDVAQFIQQTSDGGYIVAGRTSTWGNLSSAFILKLPSNGDIDPECGLIRSSNSKLTFTNNSPYLWHFTPRDTNSSFQITSGISQETNATVRLICDPLHHLSIFTTTGGTTNPSPGSYTHDYGTQVSVIAVPNSGYQFSGWSGDASGTTNPITIAMDSDKSVTANFIWQYTLTIAAGTGGTTNPSPGSYLYDSAVQVTIEAIPNSGYRFSNWSGDASGTTNPITITMDSDKSIIANFIRQYTLTISAGTGGTTNPIPGSHPCDSGTQVSVTAIPNSGYQFSGWSGDASGTVNPITITMNADKSVTANFTPVIDPKSCFIATAAYGSLLHPSVKILRDFRDKYLMPSKIGRKFVDFYYKYSPSLADLIAKHKVLRITLQINLLPLVAFSYSMLHFGPTILAFMLAFVFALPIFFIWFYRRK